LKDVYRLGIVRDSSLVAALRPTLPRGAVFVPLHYVVVSKESVVEILARDVDVFRIAGSPGQAALSSLSP